MPDPTPADPREDVTDNPLYMTGAVDELSWVQLRETFIRNTMLVPNVRHARLSVRDGELYVVVLFEGDNLAEVARAVAGFIVAFDMGFTFRGPEVLVVGVDGRQKRYGVTLVRVDEP